MYIICLINNFLKTKNPDFLQVGVLQVAILFYAVEAVGDDALFDAEIRREKL